MKSKKLILIMGIAGSGKSSLAKKLTKKLNAVWLNADKIRSKYNDWDFSKSGIIRQSERVKKLAQSVRKKFVIADLICPLRKGRKILNPDYLIWVDTIKKSRFKKKRLEKIFENPKNYDIRVTSKNSLLWSKLIFDKIQSYRWNNQNTTAIMLGRYQPFHIGHEKLFERSLEKVDQVLICVKDVYNLGDNPFKFNEVKKLIDKKLYRKFKSRYKVVKLPNITNIFYGRKVGYNIKKINLEKQITEISGTKIRKSLRKQKKLKLLNNEDKTKKIY